MHDLLPKNSILEISVWLGGILQFRKITSQALSFLTPPPSSPPKKAQQSKNSHHNIIITFTIYFRKMPVNITLFTYQVYPFTMHFLVFWHTFDNYKNTISRMSCIIYCPRTQIFPISVFNIFLILASALLSYYDVINVPADHICGW